MIFNLALNNIDIQAVNYLGFHALSLYLFEVFVEKNFNRNHLKYLKNKIGRAVYRNINNSLHQFSRALYLNLMRIARWSGIELMISG